MSGRPYTRRVPQSTSTGLERSPALPSGKDVRCQVSPFASWLPSGPSPDQQSLVSL